LGLDWVWFFGAWFRLRLHTSGSGWAFFFGGGASGFILWAQVGLIFSGLVRAQASYFWLGIKISLNNLGLNQAPACALLNKWKKLGLSPNRTHLYVCRRGQCCKNVKMAFTTMNLDVLNNDLY
jgi:hypothetical protein